MLWRGNELTYCLNVHPGESLGDVYAAVEGPVRAVRERVSPNDPFGLGLRLSAAAVVELLQPGKLLELRRRLDELGMYAFTVNGFPYGTFHGRPVKDRVYLPDWTTPERLAYTTDLAEVMAVLAPLGTKATISSLPLGYRLHGDTEERRAACAKQLTQQVIALWRLRQKGGAFVALGLEPEPHCLLETTADVIAFFGEYMHASSTLEEVARACGVGVAAAFDIVREHLGVCLDTCHAAVEFEEPDALLNALERAQIEVMKVQVSSGLRIAAANPAECVQLETFDEPVYLHQVVARLGSNALKRYADIQDALRDPEARGHEWRVHFHVPVHESRLAVFDSTQPFIVELLQRQRRSPFCSHWEIETYTWDVLPIKPVTLVDSIVSEFAWVQGQM